MSLWEDLKEKINDLNDRQEDQLYKLADIISHNLMNLQEDRSAIAEEPNIMAGFIAGHKQARHAAAEMVLEMINEFIRDDKIPKRI